MRELYKDLDIVAVIKKKSSEWIGNVARMDNERLVKKIFESKPGGRRRKRRPGLRWVEDVEEDLLEMKVKGWRQKTMERE